MTCSRCSCGGWGPDEERDRVYREVASLPSLPSFVETDPMVQTDIVLLTSATVNVSSATTTRPLTRGDTTTTTCRLRRRALGRTDCLLTQQHLSLTPTCSLQCLTTHASSPLPLFPLRHLPQPNALRRAMQLPRLPCLEGGKEGSKSRQEGAGEEAGQGREREGGQGQGTRIERPGDSLMRPQRPATNAALRSLSNARVVTAQCYNSAIAG